MQNAERSEVTRILATLRKQDEAQAEERTAVTARVFELLYAELRRIAGGMLRGERAGHTLQATALVHEAYAKLVDQERVDWQGRAHFLGVAGQAMRRVLIDYARRRTAEKRGGNRERVTLSNVAGDVGREILFLELDDALNKLAVKSERAARVAELKVFAGMTGDEIAEALGVSRRTVTGDWQFARVWLARELAA